MPTIQWRKFFGIPWALNLISLSSKFLGFRMAAYRPIFALYGSEGTESTLHLCTRTLLSSKNINRWTGCMIELTLVPRPFCLFSTLLVSCIVQVFALSSFSALALEQKNDSCFMFESNTRCLQTCSFPDVKAFLDLLSHLTILSFFLSFFSIVLQNLNFLDER